MNDSTTIRNGGNAIAPTATVRLEEIELHDGLRYDSLVDQWVDIVAIARRGHDAAGRAIRTLIIRCIDGSLRGYDPATIVAMAEDD